MANVRRFGLDEMVAHFEALEDPRSAINQQHPLVSVVVRFHSQYLWYR